jgi:hypothetical protein
MTVLGTSLSGVVKPIGADVTTFNQGMPSLVCQAQDLWRAYGTSRCLQMEKSSANQKI